MREDARAVILLQNSKQGVHHYIFCVTYFKQTGGTILNNTCIFVFCFDVGTVFIQLFYDYGTAYRVWTVE